MTPLNHTDVLWLGMGLLYLGNTKNWNGAALSGIAIVLISLVQRLGWIHIFVPTWAQEPIRLLSFLVLCTGFVMLIAEWAKKHWAPSPATPDEPS